MVCPRSHRPLEMRTGFLVSDSGIKYPIVDGVPVMLLDDIQPTMMLVENSLKRAWGQYQDVRVPELYLESLGLVESEKVGIIELYKAGNCDIDPVVSFLIGATNGIMYRSQIGNLKEYPIPGLPLPRSQGESFLDIGCNWGRWCIAAERLGYKSVGIDPSLGAIMAARRVAQQLKAPIDYVVGDGRCLPFRSDSFDVVFSYSVLQHLSRENVEQTLAEINRVLKPNGRCLIQMAHKWGIRSIYHQASRGFREAHGFEVRYWSVGDLKKSFRNAIGEPKVFVDCFFGLGLQKSDIQLMSLPKKCLIYMSEFLKKVSSRLSFFIYLADSLFVESWKPQ